MDDEKLKNTAADNAETLHSETEDVSTPSDTPDLLSFSDPLTEDDIATNLFDEDGDAVSDDDSLLQEAPAADAGESSDDTADFDDLFTIEPETPEAAEATSIPLPETPLEDDAVAMDDADSDALASDEPTNATDDENAGKTPLPGKRLFQEESAFDDDENGLPDNVSDTVLKLHDDDTADHKSGKKKSGRRKGLIAAIVIVVLLGAAYTGGVVYFKDHFYPGTSIGGVSIGGMTASDVNTMMTDNASNHSLTLEERGGTTEVINASQVSMQYKDDGSIDSMINGQNPLRWPLEIFNSNDANTANFTYDNTALTNALNGLSAVSGANVVKTQNAKPIIENGKVTIQQEVVGNELDINKLAEAVSGALISGEDTLNLEEAGCYKAPTYTTESPEVQTAAQAMETALKTQVTYTFGSATEVLTSTTFAPWISADDNLQIQVDTAQAAAYVQTLADKYDTVGNTRSFTTSLGSVVSVSGGTYGWEIDVEEEAAALPDIIRAGQAVTREPVYAQEAVSRTSPEYGNTYVEISISAQHMWMYVNGSQIVSTPITTGTAGSYDTPTGTYYLVYKATDVTLTGADYSSPVTFWMPFIGDQIGIHDSSWRSQYGGAVYLTSGSHGCINTPYAAAQTIYNNISAGCPVIVW